MISWTQNNDQHDPSAPIMNTMTLFASQPFPLNLFVRCVVLLIMSQQLVSDVLPQPPALTAAAAATPVVHSQWQGVRTRSGRPFIMRGSAAEEIAMAAAAITECTWLVPVENFHDGLPENLRDLGWSLQTCFFQCGPPVLRTA